MTVKGFFEPASLEVDHYEAGTGGDLLRLRFYLVLGASGLSIL